MVGPGRVSPVSRRWLRYAQRCGMIHAIWWWLGNTRAWLQVWPNMAWIARVTVKTIARIERSHLSPIPEVTLTLSLTGGSSIKVLGRFYRRGCVPLWIIIPSVPDPGGRCCSSLRSTATCNNLNLGHSIENTKWWLVVSFSNATGTQCPTLLQMARVLLHVQLHRHGWTEFINYIVCSGCRPYIVHPEGSTESRN